MCVFDLVRLMMFRRNKHGVTRLTLDKLLDRFEHRVTVDSILRSQSPPSNTTSMPCSSETNSSAPPTTKGAESSNSQLPLGSSSNSRRSTSKQNEKGHTEVKAKSQETAVEKGGVSKKASESSKSSVAKLQSQAKPPGKVTELSSSEGEASGKSGGVSTTTRKGGNSSAGGSAARDRDASRGRGAKEHSNKGTSGTDTTAKEVSAKEHHAEKADPSGKKQAQKKKTPNFSKAPRFTRSENSEATVSQATNEPKSKERGKQRNDNVAEGRSAKVKNQVSPEGDLTQEQWDSSEEMDLLGDSEEEEVGKKTEEDGEGSGELDSNTTTPEDQAGRWEVGSPPSATDDSGEGSAQQRTPWGKTLVATPPSKLANVWEPLPHFKTDSTNTTRRRNSRVSHALQQAIDSTPLQNYAIEGELDERNCSLLNQHLLSSQLALEHQRLSALEDDCLSLGRDDSVSLVDVLKRSKVDCFQEYLPDAMMDTLFRDRFTWPSLRSLIGSSSGSLMSSSFPDGTGRSAMQGSVVLQQQRWNAMARPSQLLRLVSGEGGGGGGGGQIPPQQPGGLEPNSKKDGKLEPNTKKGGKLEPSTKTGRSNASSDEDPAILQKISVDKTKQSKLLRAAEESLSAIFGGGSGIRGSEGSHSSKIPLIEDPCILKVTPSLSSEDKRGTAVSPVYLPEDPLPKRAKASSLVSSALTDEDPLPKSSDIPSVFPSALDSGEANFFSTFSTGNSGSVTGDKKLLPSLLSALSAKSDATPEKLSGDGSSRSCDPKILSVQELEQLMTGEDEEGSNSESQFRTSDHASRFQTSEKSQFHSKGGSEWPDTLLPIATGSEVTKAMGMASPDTTGLNESKGMDNSTSSSSLPNLERWACPATPTSMEAWSVESSVGSTPSKSDLAHTTSDTMATAAACVGSQLEEGKERKAIPTLTSLWIDAGASLTNESEHNILAEGDWPIGTEDSNDIAFLVQCFPDLEEVYLTQLLSINAGNIEETVSMALLSSSMSVPSTPLSSNAYVGREYEMQTSAGSTVSLCLTQDDSKSVENLIYESDESLDMGSCDHDKWSRDQATESQKESEKSHLRLQVGERSNKRSHDLKDRTADVTNDEEIARALQESWDQEDEDDEEIARTLQEALDREDKTATQVDIGVLQLENGSLEHQAKDAGAGEHDLEGDEIWREEDEATWSCEEEVDEGENLLLKLTPSLAKQLQNLFGSIQEHLPLHGTYVCMLCM